MDWAIKQLWAFVLCCQRRLPPFIENFYENMRWMCHEHCQVYTCELHHYQQTSRFCLRAWSLSCAACRVCGPSAERRCTDHDLSYGVAFLMQSGDLSSLINFAALIFLIRSYVFYLNNNVYSTAPSFTFCHATWYVAFTEYDKRAKTTGNHAPPPLSIKILLKEVKEKVKLSIYMPWRHMGEVEA